MIRRVLTIAGSDPGGGAGLQADLKTFSAFGVYGMSVVTAVTVQNTLGVRAVNPVAPRLAAAQAEAVLADIGADAVKLGMLATPGIVKAAAGCLKKHAVKNIVLDPVLRAKDGRALLSPAAEGALKKLLLPLALVVTPNAPEAARLAGVRVKNFSDARRAAKIISGLGPRFVLVKGGHIAGKLCRDLLYGGGVYAEFTYPRIDTRDTHGTGCTLSAAIASCLALGMEPGEAVKESGIYLAGAIKNSFRLGGGHGPLNHFWRGGLKVPTA